MMDTAINLTHEERMQELLNKAVKLYDLEGVHPAANLFPFMAEDDFEGLVADIRTNGFVNPVLITSEQLILDGRNRICASVVVELDAPIEFHNPIDPVQYVLSENLHRRHLTTGQKAMLGLEVEAIYAEQAKKRQQEYHGNQHDKSGLLRNSVKVQVQEKLGPNLSTGQKAMPRLEVGGTGITPAKEIKFIEPLHAAKKAAEKVGVNKDSIRQAKKIADVSPQLKLEVERGDKTLNTAYKEARKLEQELKQLTQQPEHRTEINAVIELPDHLGNLHEVPKPKSKATFNPQKGTEIGWAMWSWNPVTGCRHGCDYCYARAIATSKTMEKYYPTGFEPLFHWERLDAPKNTNVPADATFVPEKGRVFVCSMADLFGAWVPQEWIEKVVRATKENEQWEYLYLTKFPQRYHKLDLPSTGWIGASIDSQQRLQPTLEALNKVDNVKVKWLSLEPLLEPLQFDSLEGVDWIVIGAQSENIGQNKAFAPHFEWVLDIVNVARRDGCKVWLKTNLLGETNGNFPGMQMLQEIPF